jgi:hypothetical protein
MIRYTYLNVLNPPAPFVYVTLSNPLDGREQKDCPAQVDHGADRTVLPESLVIALGLPRTGTLVVGGLGGTVHHLSLHAVNLQIHNLVPLSVVVACNAGEPWILLGRDVLNSYRVLLDGPGEMLELP